MRIVCCMGQLNNGMWNTVSLEIQLAVYLFMTRVIKDVVTVIGRGVGAAVVSVGLVLDEGVAWGDCIDVSENSAELLQSTITSHIRPLLTGRELGSFRELSAEVDTLEEQVTLIDTHYPPPPEGVSRRALLRVDFEEKQPEPIVTEREVIRPIAASIRYGVSQALLAGVALAQGRLAMQIICDEYQLPLPEQSAPILGMLKPNQSKAAQKMFGYQIAGLGIRFSGDDPEQELGKKGEFAQRTIRLLKDAALAAGDHEFEASLFLDAGGGYGSICDGVVGKVLGNLSGLITAGKPFSTWVVDPFTMSSIEPQLEKMSSLVEFVKLRNKMPVKIVARRFVDSLATVNAFLDAKAAHVLMLDPQRLGSLHVLIEAALACKQAGVGVIVGGDSAETPHATSLSTQVALALAPEFVLAKPASQVGVVTVGNEMARIIEELHLVQA